MDTAKNDAQRPPVRAYTYILRCADDSLYCGWTNDLTARLAAHNGGRGAKYTRGRGPVTLVYSEQHATQGDAMRREAAIKRLSRPQKLALLAAQDGAERLTIYDADGRPCGERPRAVVHAQGLYHRVCHLWVVGVWAGVPGLWLQQRQFDRPLYPGGFDLTATGHLDPGETPSQAVQREAREEVGLVLPDAALADGGHYRQQYRRGADGGFDDELAFAFAVRMDGVPPFALGSEVADVVFVSLADFAAAHDAPRDLPARRRDGSAVTLAHDSLCCLHPQERQGVQPVLDRLLGR